MPQNLNISPKNSFKKGKIQFTDIPVNTYNKSVKDVKDQFAKEDLIRIYRDMRYIREFETSLDQIKKEGSYQGMEYNHKGPAHLSIGQEATAVGEAYHLGVEDHIYGSHRSHGEILAKGLVAIEKLSDKDLDAVMRNFMGGATLKVVEKIALKGSLKDLARKYLIYGAYAEIFARETGFNRGLGGSMHAFFTPFGIYPNNAIVGGSATITAGAALFKRVNRKDGVIICNIGDASFACGPVWEALSFASMDQYRNLWDASLGGGLPIIFAAINNQYGMGGQTCGETMGYQMLARIGAGVNPEQMHAERVNGYNPLAVMDAIQRKKELALAGKGPILLDVITYRVSGHSPSDASSYRSKEEIQEWVDADSVKCYGQQLLEAGILTPNELAKVDDAIINETKDCIALAINLDASPRFSADSEEIGSLMFSNEKVEAFDDRPSEINLENNPRLEQISRKDRVGIKDGKLVSKMKAYNVRDGLFEAMVHRFEKDPTMVAFGEENRDWGGAFAVYRGLTEALPYHRLFNSPIAEASIVGAAVGYALEGGRAVAELMYCDFLGRAGDEVFNQLSKWQSMSGGVLKMPVVLRISVGAKYGAQHSQDWSTFVAHCPGLKVVFPVTPYDAKGMLNTALAGTDPVIFFESQSIYDLGELFEKDGVPEGYYEIPFGEPAVRRQGKDITIMTLGPALYRALEVADLLKEKYGMEAEVIDLRCANPLDYTSLVSSIEKTGKALLITEACERGSYMHHVASTLSTLAFDYLDAPVAVVGSRNWITPAAELEDLFFPMVAGILDAIHERIIPLPGHQCTTRANRVELMRRNRLGV